MSASDEVFMADGVQKEPKRWKEIQVPLDGNHERPTEQPFSVKTALLGASYNPKEQHSFFFSDIYTPNNAIISSHVFL